jgi:hypothetical protein
MSCHYDPRDFDCTLHLKRRRRLQVLVRASSEEKARAIAILAAKLDKLIAGASEVVEDRGHPTGPNPA